MLHVVLRDVFGVVDSESAGDTASANPSPTSGLVDENSLAETAVYRARLGRWRKATLLITSCLKFRFILEAVSVVHVVFSHLQHDLMKTNHPNGQFLFMLFQGDVKYTDLLNGLTARAKWLHMLERCDDVGVSAEVFVGLVFWHVSTALVCYERRIGSCFRSYPHKVFLLIAKYPNIVCTLRKRIAAELLSLPQHVIGDTVTKIVRRFKTELEDAVNTGLLCEDYRNAIAAAHTGPGRRQRLY